MLQDIIGAKAALFSDKGQTVLRGHENRNRRVVLLKGNLVQNSRSETRGINARVNLDGLFGFASIAEYTPEAADKVIRAATDNALFLSRHTDKKIILPPSTGTGAVPLNRDIVDTEQQMIIDACRKIDRYIEDNYQKLTSRTVVYSEDSMDKII